MIPHLAFWLSHLAWMPDGVSINGRFEAERTPALAGPLSGGRAATFVPYVWHWLIRPMLHLVGQGPAGFESQLIPDLPLPFIPTLIGLQAFDLVSSSVWWEAATNIHLEVWWAYWSGSSLYNILPGQSFENQFQICLSVMTPFCHKYYKIS